MPSQFECGLLEGFTMGLDPRVCPVFLFVTAMVCRERWNELNSRVMFLIKRKEKT